MAVSTPTMRNNLPFEQRDTRGLHSSKNIDVRIKKTLKNMFYIR